PRSAPPLPGRRPLAPPAIAADSPSPFETGAIAGGQPTVEARDALQDALVDPFADDGAPAAATPEAAAPAPGADPFGAPPAGGADPFGAPPAGDADPFGGDPFG